MAKDKELQDHERAHTGKAGSKVDHGSGVLNKGMLRGANTTSRVREALRNSGYMVENSDFHVAKYTGKRSVSGDEIHKVHFTNEDTGKPDSGHVYLKNKSGKLFGEY